MTVGDATLDDAVLLAGRARRDLKGRPASLVLRDDGRIGYAAADTFLPVGDDDDLQRITVNSGKRRGTSVISLEFGAGEVRETVGESAAVVSKRLREEGYSVSAAALGRAGSPPPEQPLEHLDGTPPGAGTVAPAAAAAVGARPSPAREPEPEPEQTAAIEAEAPQADRAATPPVQPEPAADERAQVEQEQTAEGKPERRRRFSPALLARAGAGLGRGTISLLRLAVLIVGGVVAGILIIYVLMVLLKANPANGLVKFFKDASKPLAWQFKDLFTPKTRRANITENYGLAAVVYLVVTVAITRVLAGIGKKTQR